MTLKRLSGGAVAAIAIALLAVPEAHGAGATYNVLKCHVNSRGVTEAVSETRGAYATQNRCGSDDQRLEITNSGFTTAGQTGYYRFNAPYGTEIVGVYVRANLRRDNHHQAQLVLLDAWGNRTVFANGPDTGEGFRSHAFSGSRWAALVIHLTCGNSGGCPTSSQAHAYAQNIELVLRDAHDPQVTLSGELFSGGWQRGSRELLAQASDVGSGLEVMRVSVNGSQVAGANGSCGGVLGGPYSSVLVPCPIAPSGAFTSLRPDTAFGPFTNGPNIVSACGEDFAGNTGYCTSRNVQVDNAAPQMSFPDQLDPDDPERVVVAVYEPHSGIAGGTISVRRVGSSDWTPLNTKADGDALEASVPSSSFPPGEYEFRAQASDVAGNGGETTLRADGEPMRATFPMRARAKVMGGIGDARARRQTLRYGRDTSVRGRVVDGSNEPLGGVEVTVEEFFGAGALIDKRVRTVVTEPDGSWSARIPAGPSRTITATYGGSPKFQPDSAEVGRVTVRSRASFATSREEVKEGGTVAFTGKVGHFGARIPSAGKLVELQVREGPGRWNTVKEAFHTAPSGRYRTKYRFGRFYESDAEFRFRVKVAQEQAWPYKAPVRSRARAVTVLAR